MFDYSKKNEAELKKMLESRWTDLTRDPGNFHSVHIDKHEKNLAKQKRFAKDQSLSEEYLS